MPARRKPTSTRQKKADVQLKRAIKRGDVPPPDSKKHPHPKARRRDSTGHIIGSSTSDPAIQAARRLQSAFITLPPDFLEETKFLASTLPLPRPIHPEAAAFVDSVDSNDGSALSCPCRPKWRFDMTKKEVEHNEEGVFKKWLEGTDSAIKKWLDSKESKVKDIQDQDSGTPEPLTMPRSPTFFERNLEVWRQLYVSNSAMIMAPFMWTNSDGELRRYHRSSLFFLTLAVLFYTSRLPSPVIFQVAMSSSYSPRLTSPAPRVRKLGQNTFSSIIHIYVWLKSSRILQRTRRISKAANVMIHIFQPSLGKGWSKRSRTSTQGCWSHLRKLRPT